MKEKLKKQLANLVTILRVMVLTPITVCLIVQKHEYWALLFFIITALTDKLDGYLARKYGKTDFGEKADPIADKVFVAATLFSITAIYPFPVFILVVIVLREVTVTIIRFLPDGGKVKVNLFGKVKATCQYVGIGYAILLWPYYVEIMAIVAIITMASGIAYAYKYAQIINE